MELSLCLRMPTWSRLPSVGVGSVLPLALTLTTVLVANKFRNAGQVCVTANRVYVQQSIHDDFVSLVAARVRALRLGHGLDVSSTMGSVTTLRGVERCGTLVEDASKHGAKVIIGGRRVGTGYQFEPTLLVGAGHDSLVHREEMFAPILSVYSFETEEEVCLSSLSVSR